MNIIELALYKPKTDSRQCKKDIAERDDDMCMFTCTVVI